MRTYKRRVQERFKIEDVQELCRLCLDKTESGLPIFRDEQDVCAAIAMRIMICVGLEMKQDDCLPNMICASCHDELERYYKFRRKCEVTFHKLKSHMLAVKYKDHKDIQMDDKDIEIRNMNLEDKNMKIEQNHMQIELVTEMENKVSKMENKNVQMKHKDTEMENYNGMNENGQLEKKFMLIDQPVEDKYVDPPEEKKQDVPKEQEQVIGNPIEKVPEQNKVVYTEEIPIQTDSNPNIDTFLSAILTELGVLGSREERLVFNDEGITTFELETGDGDQMVLELVEEEDDVENQHLQPLAVDSAKHGDNDDDIEVIRAKAKRSNKGVKKVSGPWCATCGRVFSTRSAAVRHARAHAGEPQHACPVCRRTFQQKAVMERHQLVHLDVRPFQCGVCNKSFTQRGSLAAHSRTHADPLARPLALHRCTVCDKVFLYASGLTRHMMTHTGRVYECSSCDKKFSDRSSLLRHLRNFFHQVKHSNDHQPANNADGTPATSKPKRRKARRVSVPVLEWIEDSQVFKSFPEDNKS